MSEKQQPFHHPDAPARPAPWRLEVQGDGSLRIEGRDADGSPLSHSLGPKDEAFAVMVAAMEADDFGERG